MTTATASPPRDLLAFRATAQRYLVAHGLGEDEDLLSTMTLWALEHPQTSRAMRFVFLEALKAVRGYHQLGGVRCYDTQRLCSYEALQEAGWEPAVTREAPAVADEAAALPSGCWDMTIPLQWIQLT